MDGLTTVFVVHEMRQPSVRALVVLCSEHAAILKRASWAGVDELVGFSTVIDCEACAMPPDESLPLHTDSWQGWPRHLHPLPTAQQVS
jgi:hypothetical protein